MVRRLFDLCIAIPALIGIAPVLLLAATGIRLSSRGPIFYRASRVGRGGRTFTMFKLRTMHCRAVAGSSITSANDPRVFPVGRLLRALKIDELPQLLNIMKGDMAIVGPRPEAPDIVERYYTVRDRESLAVAPGLTSPGSVFYYTHGEQLLADGAAEDFYVTQLLPRKMTIDLEYLSRASLWSDIGVIFSTASVLVQKALGRKQFPTPAALKHLEQVDGGDERSARSAA
jgi:lipopolysaccharide/colanic/teichoic acid biosynthesis glycosyltransferase